MNETAIVYIVHSDLDENNIFAMFEDEIEAIMYARKHKEDLTYVDRTEMSLDESGDYDEVLSAETIWVYDEDVDPEDIEGESELSDEELFNIDFDELERTLNDEDDTTWFEDLDTDKLVETLEENEDIVECKECFELFPKEACTKVAIGYICPECGKIHSHEEPEFEIDSIPDVVIADEDTFKIDFPEVERMDYENDMIPDEPTPEVGPNPEPMTEPCVGPECEAPVEAPVTKDETITKLVVDEHEAIDGYDKAKIEIEANSELDEEEKEEILDTIEHIKEEEIEHIEELEELVDEVEETKADEPAEDSGSEEHEVLTEEVLTETIADIFSGIGNFFQKGVNAVKDFFVSGWNAVGGSKFALDDFYSPEGKYNTNKEHGNGYTVYGYNDKKEKVQQQKFNKLGKAYEYAVELSKALGKTALSVIEITDYKDEGKPILAIFKDGDVTDKTKDIILNKANTLSKELTQLDRQKAHQKKADELKNAETKKEEPKDDKKPDEEKEKQDDELVHASQVADKGKGAKLNAIRKNNKTIVKVLKDAGFDVSSLTVSYQDSTKKNRTKASDKLNKLRKDLLKDLVKEALEEHINEEHPAVESDQKLVGTDNAVVDCKINKVITHSEDEKPVDCKGTKKPLEKPLTESLSKDQLQVMEEYLKATKFASLETEWTDEGEEGNFYIDECGAYLRYNHSTNKFELSISTYHSSEDNNAEYPEYHTEEEDYSYDSLAEMYDDGAFTEILNWLYEENSDRFTKSLFEETHAKYAKPEGNRVQAFNNALKYAKKENKPFIYGYSQMGDGKFFALEQPIKVSSTPAEAEKEFKNRHKRCSVVYMVYPDKEFIREGLFTKAEQEEYNMDEDGNSLDSYDTYVRCGFCDEIYTKSECKYERNLGWLCPRCEAAIYSRGEKLTFVDPDEFLEN